MRSNEKYSHLAYEGYARQHIDWLYGINYKRYATIKSQTLLRVGRVITPIVTVVYDREKEVANFISTPFYQLSSKEVTNDVPVELLVKEKYEEPDNEEMIKLLDSLNTNESLVTDISKNDKAVQSPKLFSQSDLQNFLKNSSMLQAIH